MGRYGFPTAKKNWRKTIITLYWNFRDCSFVKLSRIPPRPDLECMMIACLASRFIFELRPANSEIFSTSSANFFGGIPINVIKGPGENVSARWRFDNEMINSRSCHQEDFAA